MNPRKTFILSLVAVIILVILYIVAASLAHNGSNLIIRIFNKFDDIDKQNLVNIVLFLGLFWTVLESFNFRKQTKELDEKPVLTLFIRNMGTWKDEKKEENKDYVFDAYWLLRIRNVGKGAALNLFVTSDKFNVTAYRTKIIGPISDEQSIQIRNKDGTEIANGRASDLNNACVTIFCVSVAGKKYQYDYQIKSVGQYEVDYLGEKILT